MNIRVVMEFDNIETIKQAVQIGAGVSILPEPTVRQSDQRGEFGDCAADCPGTAAADRHHPSPAEGVYAHGGQVRRVAAEVQAQARRKPDARKRKSPSPSSPWGENRLRPAGNQAARGGRGRRAGARPRLRRTRPSAASAAWSSPAQSPSQRPPSGNSSPPMSCRPAAGWDVRCRSWGQPACWCRSLRWPARGIKSSTHV